MMLLPYLKKEENMFCVKKHKECAAGYHDISLRQDITACSNISPGLAVKYDKSSLLCKKYIPSVYENRETSPFDRRKIDQSTHWPGCLPIPTSNPSNPSNPSNLEAAEAISLIDLFFRCLLGPQNMRLPTSDGCAGADG